MIKFQSENIQFKFVWLKSITTALGGSLTYLDEETNSILRMDCPFAIARSFIKLHKGHTQYLKPVLTCIMMYDDLIIGLERHPLGSLGKIEEDGVFGVTHWKPNCQIVYNDFIIPTMEGTEWYFDGRYAYTFDHDNLDGIVDEGRHLTKDGRFRAIEVAAIDFQEIKNGEDSAESVRLCIAFVDNGKYAISPPVWKDGFNLTEGENRFDYINDCYGVNLNFVLKAGTEIGKAFGYRSTEILDLARLMIELKTVNMPNLSKELKETYNTQLPFQTMFAWLLGVQNKADTLKTYLITRSMLSYLTKKGIFKKNSLNVDQVFNEGYTNASIPLANIDDLSDQFKQESTQALAWLDDLKTGS